MDSSPGCTGQVHTAQHRRCIRCSTRKGFSQCAQHEQHVCICHASGSACVSATRVISTPLCRNRCFRCLWSTKFGRDAAFAFSGRYQVPATCTTNFELWTHTLVSRVDPDADLLKTSERLKSQRQVRSHDLTGQLGCLQTLSDCSGVARTNCQLCLPPHLTFESKAKACAIRQLRPPKDHPGRAITAQHLGILASDPVLMAWNASPVAEEAEPGRVIRVPAMSLKSQLVTRSDCLPSLKRRAP